MTAWAVNILHDDTTYPMFATASASFGALSVLARVEWHVTDFQNQAQHRGVTLYQRTQADVPAPYAEGIDVSHYQPNICLPASSVASRSSFGESMCEDWVQLQAAAISWMESFSIWVQSRHFVPGMQGSTAMV